MNTLTRIIVAALSLALAAPAFAKSASRTRLLTSPNPAQAGRIVQMRAEVDGLGGGAPRGTVRFSDGSVALGSATLSPYGAGQATVGGHCNLTSAGGVKCWGNNRNGELGDGTQRGYVFPPVTVSGLSSGVVAITTGGYHSCALTSAGAVKCWGFNNHGQLGDGTTTNRPTPVAVSDLSSGGVAIATGRHHSCALVSGGRIKCWGNNGGGQIGDGTTTNRPTPVTVSGFSSGGVAIAMGGRYSCALTSAGAVKCWGAHIEYIYYSDPDFPEFYSIESKWKIRTTPSAVSGLSSGVVAITTAGLHSCALTSAGVVKCWGDNTDGALGHHYVGDIWYYTTPVAVTGLSSGIVAISTYGGNSCALTSAGVVKCWGLDFSDASGRTPPTRVMAGLVRARASLPTHSLGVGTHSLEATYSGSATHLPSSGARSQTIIP